MKIYVCDLLYELKGWKIDFLFHGWAYVFGCWEWMWDCYETEIITREIRHLWKISFVMHMIMCYYFLCGCLSGGDCIHYHDIAYASVWCLSSGLQLNSVWCLSGGLIISGSYSYKSMQPTHNCIECDLYYWFDNWLNSFIGEEIFVNFILKGYELTVFFLFLFDW